MNTKKKERIFESLKILIIIPYVLAMSMSDIVLRDPLEQPILLAEFLPVMLRCLS